MTVNTGGVSDPRSAPPVVGGRDGFSNVIRDVRRILGLTVNVLILGESGTGKEVVARSIHCDDPKRCHRPFVPLNCAALPEQVLEADLFGYRRGSFTGATTDREGIFRQADGGTVFLDEVGELPLLLQPKLLRVLQERAVRPLGRSEETAIDVRVVAATNRDLAESDGDGSFRLDLYYRLADYVISVPPLRQRRQDIVPLSHHFLDMYRIEFGREHVNGFAEDALNWLQLRDWSANNVRELSVAVKRAVLFCDGPMIQVYHLAATTEPMPGPQRLDGADLPERLQDALCRTDGNIAAAARLLGMKRSTLFDRLTKLGLRGGAG